MDVCLKEKWHLFFFLSLFPSPPCGQPPEWRCYINKHLQPGLPQSSLNQRPGQIRELISNVQPCIISRKLRRFPPKLLVSNCGILIAEGTEQCNPCFLQEGKMLCISNITVLFGFMFMMYYLRVIYWNIYRPQLFTAKHNYIIFFKTVCSLDTVS